MTSRRHGHNRVVTVRASWDAVPGNLRGSIGNPAKCCLVVLLLRVSGDAMIYRTVSTYFDHNATTPVAPEVVAAMADALASTFGNASSVHAYGQRAKAA